MNLPDYILKLVQFALSQVGVTETGDNCTAYAKNYDFDEKLYGFDMNGLAWCDYFVDFCFIKCFGFEKALELTYQYHGCQGAACRFSANYYKNHGAWSLKPEIGDQVFFYYSGDINHTGIVIDVKENYIFTVEGNSHDAVRENQYRITDSCIAGYGIPNWKVLDETSEPKNEEEVLNDTPTGYNNYISTGDIVSLSDDAEYYSGVAIPLWVRRQNWIVLSVNGDRAVINWNEDHTNNIMSPVNTKYLTKLSSVYDDEGEEPKEEKVIDISPEETLYEVKKGDTLWAIAFRFLKSGPRYKEIKVLNNLTSDIIYPGQILKLPNE